MFGLHVKRNSDGDIMQEIKYYRKQNIKCVQFFIKSPQRAVGKLSSDKKKELLSIQQFCNNNNISMYVHAPYSINLGQVLTDPMSDKLDWWVLSVIKEIRYANEFGVSGIIVHVGKYLQIDPKISLKNMYDALKIIVERTQKYKTEFLLETPAGQGTELLSDFNDFLSFYKNMESWMRRKIFVCLDLCHMFSSGVDLRTKQKVDDLIKKIDSEIKLSSVHLIHFNDSKEEYNAHRDVHESVGQGKIGVKGMKRIFKWAKKYNIPMILETPHNNIENDLKLINKWNIG